jgi:hypothetical protein
MGGGYSLMATDWFVYDDLRPDYTYHKVQAINSLPLEEQHVNNVLIPRAINYVESAIGQQWDKTTVPADLLLVAKNIAVNMILADDENVKIAQARGQPSFTVAGDQVVLDLTPGRNPFLSDADEAVILFYQQKFERELHVDKVRVQSQGDLYDEAVGRGTEAPVDYVRPSYMGRRPFQGN